MSEELVQAITEAQNAVKAYDADIARTEHGHSWQLAESKREAFRRVDEAFKAMVKENLDELLRQKAIDDKVGKDW